MTALVLNLFLRSAIICLAACTLRCLLPRYAARERHAVLFASFLLLLFWPLLALFLPELDVALPSNAPPDGSVTVQEFLFVSVHPVQATFAYLPVALWLFGVTLSLLPLLLGYPKALSITRQANPLNYPLADELLSSLCAQYGRTRKPSLLVMSAPLMPFLFGILKPKILVPSDSANWSDARWRTVLLHELAHVQRCDVGAQMLAHLVTALWWFQPLCRLNYLALRQESEQACDAIALSSGVKASDYAAELVQLARTNEHRLGYSSSAVMMAGRGNLEPRVRAILDSTTNHKLRHFVAAAIAPLVLITLAASAVTLKKEDNPMKRTLLSSLLTSAGLSAATIGGSLLDSNGAAIPNAKASLYNPETTVSHETATATDGKFSFSVPAGQYILRIQKPGFPSLFREFNVQDDSKIEKRLSFTQPALPSGEAPQHIRVPGAAQQEKLIQKVNPLYPVSAKRAHLQGTVSLEAVISAEGVPEDITVLSSPDDDLTQSALEAVRQWRYSTTLLNGNPIAVVTNIIVNYTLTN